MAKASSSPIGKLQQKSLQFDTNSGTEKLSLLKVLSKTKLPPPQLATYHDVLLNMLAHPESEQLVRVIESELQRITQLLQKLKPKEKEVLQNTGLAYTETRSTFSPDMLDWLVTEGDYLLNLDIMAEDSSALSNFLKLTLPNAERELTSIGYDSDELIEALGITEADLPSFVATQLGQLKCAAPIKDHLFEQLGTELSIRSLSSDFSRTYNRFSKSLIFYHQDLLKRFDAKALIKSFLPKPYHLSEAEEKELIKVIKQSLLLMGRETDPATYLNPNALSYYQLERGISIAVYGMSNERQLPFESYLGYTLFKNGFPAAYGGAWVFGKRALFGMNIFESFRGGESGYMMCQLLRVYAQAFGVNYFEVEPYQFGKDNPEGIQSGAFWFYYRHGFRPVDEKLKELAEQEEKKIAAKKGYFSPVKTLEKFTESYLCLELSSNKQITIGEWTEFITANINKAFKGNRAAAVEQGIRLLRVHANIPAEALESNQVKDYALLAITPEFSNPKIIALLAQLVIAKYQNLYQYQSLLSEFLGKLRK